MVLNFLFTLVLHLDLAIPRPLFQLILPSNTHSSLLFLLFNIHEFQSKWGEGPTAYWWWFLSKMQALFLCCLLGHTHTYLESYVDVHYDISPGWIKISTTSSSINWLASHGYKKEPVTKNVAWTYLASLVHYLSNFTGGSSDISDPVNQLCRLKPSWVHPSPGSVIEMSMLPE